MDLFDLNIGLVIQASSENRCGVIVEYPSHNVSSFYNLNERTNNNGNYFEGFDFRMFDETYSSLNNWDVVFYDTCDDDAINIKKLSEIENEVFLNLKKKGVSAINLDKKFDYHKRKRLDRLFKKTLLLLSSKKYQTHQFQDRFVLIEKEFENSKTFANQVNIDNYLNDYKIQFNYGFDYTITHYRKESSTFYISPFCAFQNNYVFDHKDGIETQRRYESSAYQVVDNRRLKLNESDGYLMNLFFLNISLKEFHTKISPHEYAMKRIKSKPKYKYDELDLVTQTSEEYEKEKEFYFKEYEEQILQQNHLNENKWLKSISKDYDINSKIEYSINLLEDRPDAYGFRPFNLDKFINFKTKTDIDFNLSSEIAMNLTTLKISEIKNKYSIENHLKFISNMHDKGVNEVHRILRMNINHYLRESLRSISKYPVRVKNRGKYSIKWIHFDFRSSGL